LSIIEEATQEELCITSGTAASQPRRGSEDMAADVQDHSLAVGSTKQDFSWLEGAGLQGTGWRTACCSHRPRTSGFSTNRTCLHSRKTLLLRAKA